MGGGLKNIIFNVVSFMNGLELKPLDLALITSCVYPSIKKLKLIKNFRSFSVKV